MPKGTATNDRHHQRHREHRLDAADEPDTAPAAESPPDPETAASVEHSHQGDDDGRGEDDGQDHGGDTFDRKYVEKLRAEAKSHRQRAETAAATIATLQRQHADHRIRQVGLKPAAVWAVTELADVLDDHGAVDSAKLREAMNTAKETLGLDNGKRRPNLNGGDPKSGATAGREPRNHVLDAFTHRTKRADW